MLQLAKKPALALGATAMLMFGTSGISSIARAEPAAGTTPDVRRGPAAGQSSAALAKALGVSTTQLEAAMKAAREKSTTTDPATEAAAQSKAIAKALDSDQATIQQVLDAQRPAGNGDGGRPAGSTPTGARPDRPAGTTPTGARPDRPAGTTPTGTAPGAGERGPGGHRGHGGGGRDLASRTTLVSALAKATGKSETVVKSALAALDKAREAERKAREAEFASNLAVELGLAQSKVSAALESSRPARPTRAAKTGTGQTT